MTCSCDKPTRSVTGPVWRLIWRAAVLAALVASPDVRKLATSLATGLTTSVLSMVALVHTRQIEQAEADARLVAARQAELQALRPLVSDTERDGVDRELVDTDAEALAVKVALGEGLRGLQGIRSAADAVSTQIARSRGHELPDRFAQAAKLREARLAAQRAAQSEADIRVVNARLEAEARREADRAARLETEIEQADALAREARESLAEANQEADRARRDADELRTELVARKAVAARAAEPHESPRCSQSDAPAGKTQPRRVVTSSYRVRTQPAE